MSLLRSKDIFFLSVALTIPFQWARAETFPHGFDPTWEPDRNTETRAQSHKCTVGLAWLVGGLLAANAALSENSSSEKTPDIPKPVRVSESAEIRDIIGIDLEPGDRLKMAITLDEVKTLLPIENFSTDSGYGWKRDGAACHGIDCLNFALLRNASFDPKAPEDSLLLTKTKLVAIARGEKQTLPGYQSLDEFYKKIPPDMLKAAIRNIQDSQAPSIYPASLSHLKDLEPRLIKSIWGIPPQAWSAPYPSVIEKIREASFSGWSNQLLPAEAKAFEELRAKLIEDMDLHKRKSDKVPFSEFIASVIARWAWDELPVAEQEKYIRQDVERIRNSIDRGIPHYLAVGMPNRHAVRAVGFITRESKPEDTYFLIVDPNFPGELRKTLAVKRVEGRLRWIADLSSHPNVVDIHPEDRNHSKEIRLYTNEADLEVANKISPIVPLEIIGK